MTASSKKGNLTQYISHLRKALGDNSEDSRLIVTISRKGYQFTVPVVVAETTDNAALAAPRAKEDESSKIDPRLEGFPAKEEVTKPSSPHLLFRKWFAAAGLSVLVVAASGLYLGYRHTVTLLATDTIVLADVKNETSDPVFDSLNTALRYEMEQTPLSEHLPPGHR